MSDTIQVLHKLLDGCAARQRVIAGNLANVNTPGYVRRDVRFQKALAEAIHSRESGKVEEVEPKMTVDSSGDFNHVGNNVSVQKEMGLMAENSILYNFAAQAIGKKYAGLRKAISSK